MSRNTAIARSSPLPTNTSGIPGTAYIFVRGASGWPTKPTTMFRDPVSAGNSTFCYSVAVSGTTAVVGAFGANSGTGAAYIYVKGCSGWPTTPTTSLADPTATADDEFGTSVAVSGATVVVGAFGTSSDTCEAYIYVEDASGWPTTPTASLADPAATADDYFGFSVAVSGTTVVVGAPGTNSGTAYIYMMGNSGWPTTPTVTLPNPTL
jgi:hypothetical protein